MDRSTWIVAGCMVLAIGVAVTWYARKSGAPRETTIAESATTARVVRHDANGLVKDQTLVRDPARVRAIVAALGVDAHPPVECPADYASADVSVVFGGADVYARRSVHVFAAASDAPSVLTVSSAGCRRGPPADGAAMRRELDAAFSRGGGASPPG